MENINRLINQKEWNENHSSVWREIVSRFGQADYDDETKRAEHKATLKAEYDAQEYARNRQKEYPSIAELTVALYDTDDKSAVEAKRAAVKLKYPKP